MVEIPDMMLRPQTLIVSLYGLYGRSTDGALPISALVSLMGDLGKDAPAVRSAVSRLKGKGVLTSVRTSGGRGYEISDAAMEIFAAGDSRIYSYPRARADDAWLLAIYSVPEEMRNKRHLLRQALSDLGFGMVSSGVWIAPVSVKEETQDRLERSGLSEFVEFFTGTYESQRIMDDVQRWWDLPEIDAQFSRFLDTYGPDFAPWQKCMAGYDDVSPEEGERLAFSYYVQLVTFWRKLPYKDPGIPLDYLPEGWKAPEAADLFNKFVGILQEQADRHALRTIHSAMKI